MSDGDVGVDAGGSAGNDSGGFDAGDVGFMVGTIIGADEARRPKPRKAEQYLEPDYGAIWAKRWAWMKAVLIAIGAGLIVLLAWATIRTDAGPL